MNDVQLLAEAYQKIIESETVGNPLDGKTNDSARKFTHNYIHPYTKGLFSDQDWSGVSRIWKALEQGGFDWGMIKTEYLKNDQGMPSAKVWTIEIHFNNKKNKIVRMIGHVTAHGAGSIQDPMGRYDITFTVF